VTAPADSGALVTPLLINGAERSVADSFPVYDPARTGAVVGYAAAASAQDALDAVRAALSAYERACAHGPLADRPLGERFRWLTAPRSAIVQPGPVHGGVTDDPAAELDRLFTGLVATRL